MRSSLRVASVLALLAVIALVPRPASAGVLLVVNSAAYPSNGAGDAAPGDGVCLDPNGECTLLAAIQESNAHAGHDGIHFAIPPGGVQTIFPLATLPAITDPVDIDGSTQPGGGARGIVIDGGQSGDTLHLTAGNTSVKGLVIHSGSSGILIDGPGGNVIQGNYIGTNLAGTAELGNTFGGVLIEESPDNLIGGTGAGDGNLISGNGFGHVQISGAGATGNHVQGNYIGTDAAGSSIIGGGKGVVIDNASGNLVGGTAAGAGNLITSDSHDVEITGHAGGVSSANVVQGNLIGTDATGTVLLKEGGFGIALNGANNQIGGTTAEARNVIAGGLHGIRLTGSEEMTGNQIQGNYIGTDITGTVGMGALFHGIEISGATGNLIGGTAPAAGNLISGNGFNDQGDATGAALSFTDEASFNDVQGNRIGVDAQGGPLGNGVGILFDFDAHDNTIGGTSPGAGNTIAFSELQGVWVPDGSFNLHPESITILGNSIHDNGFGIDVRGAGVTANDPLDADGGGNDGQNFPELVSAGPAAGGTYVVGSIESSPATNFRIEFFSNPSCHALGHGEGETPLGTTVRATDATGEEPFDVFTGPAPVGAALTATATDIVRGDTSEFSACVEVVNEADLKTTKQASPAEVPPSGIITYEVSVTNPAGPAEAVGVLVTDPIPTHTSLVIDSLLDDPGCSFDSVLNRVECSAGTILPTEGFAFDYEVEVSEDAPVPHTVTNTAEATSLTPDPNPSNSTASASTKVDCDLVGTSGNDVLLGGPGIVSICGGEGADHLLGKDGGELLVGGIGPDKLDGNLGDDVLLGGSGNDLLFGQSGNDVLRGGNDDDTLKGGPDDDELDGGPGTDGCDQQGGGGTTTACEP